MFEFTAFGVELFLLGTVAVFGLFYWLTRSQGKTVPNASLFVSWTLALCMSAIIGAPSWGALSVACGVTALWTVQNVFGKLR